jgi:two-component system chemotaxis response regulator CheY
LKKVLIVDDAAFMRLNLKNIIKEMDFEIVAEAENGLEAIEKYKEHSPDIVTMDITMPEMDGITATKEIKSFDDSANILVCSAMGQQSLVIDAIEAGAKDFIVKPFERQRIKDAMNKIFN